MSSSTHIMFMASYILGTDKKIPIEAGENSCDWSPESSYMYRISTELEEDCRRRCHDQGYVQFGLAYSFIGLVLTSVTAGMALEQ